jgi:nicotinamidase-related amidase
MKEALLLIDIQNDYFPGGKMELVDMEEAVKKAVELLKIFRTLDKPIFFIKHLSKRPNATFFIPGTLGIDFHESVSPLPEEAVIEKHFPNSFSQTELLCKLKEKHVTNLVICGAMSHMCIDTTVRAAKELGFTCTLIDDACAAHDLKFKNELIPTRIVHAAFMAALDGIFADVVTVDEYLS